MSLLIDWNECVGRAEKYPPDEEGTLHPITQMVGFSTMWVDMGEITEENWQEFFKRVHMWERSFGTVLLDGDGNKMFITAQMVRDHIGLKTNVLTKPTRTFNARIIRELSSNANRALITERLDMIDKMESSQGKG